MGANGLLRTTILLAMLTGLFVLLGHAIGGVAGMLIAFTIALAMNAGAYWYSDRLMLTMTGAREVTYPEMPDLVGLVSSLAQRADLPSPRVFLVDSPTPNAFATGRNPDHAAVAVTTGLLQLLRYDELAGVIGHELAHIRNRDTLLSTVTATIAGAITMLAEIGQWSLLLGGIGQSDEEGSEQNAAMSLVSGILMLFLAPIAATLIQLAISRSREYRADADGALIAGDPLSLARALKKLEAANRLVPMPVQPALAHAFTIQPLSGGFATLFSTHPPVADRIARLRSMLTARRPQPELAALGI